MGMQSLRSRDPFPHPLIIPRFFDDPRDMQTLIEAIKRSINLITHSKAYKNLGTKFFDKPNPACYPKFAPFSDSYWECIARHYTYTVYHDVGTCKMGPESDPQAVVDPRLKVYGIDGLRVADAS